MNKTDYATLHAIYQKHRNRFRGNTDSNQMCCMWSTTRPPDILADTRPIADIERAFDVEIDENEAICLYDLELNEALVRIHELQRQQARADNRSRETP